MQLLKFIDQIANAWVPLLARSGENILKNYYVLYLLTVLLSSFMPSIFMR